MKLEISKNAVTGIENWMFDNIQTLAQKNTCLTTNAARVFIIVASVADASLAISLPVIHATEKLGLAAINFLGALLHFESCNFEDGWACLRDAVFFKSLSEVPQFYLTRALVAFMIPYHNFKNPLEAVSIAKVIAKALEETSDSESEESDAESEVAAVEDFGVTQQLRQFLYNYTGGHSY